MFCGKFSFFDELPQLLDHFSMNDISPELKTAIEETIANDVGYGINPIQSAASICALSVLKASGEPDQLHLTEKQIADVENYRTHLKTLSDMIFSKELRDKRFDRSVLRAIQEQKPLPIDKIDKMVERYQARQLRYRSETIARTLCMGILSKRNHQAALDAYAVAGINLSKIRRIWLIANDGNARDAHQKLAHQSVGYNEPFKSELGDILFPGDPNANPANIVNCRCAIFFSIDYLSD